MRGPTVCQLFVVCMLAVLHPGAHAQLEEEIIMGSKGTTGVISTMGGTIRVFRGITKPGSNVTLKTGEIAVSFSQLRELTSNLTQVVDNFNRTHAIKSFSAQMFTCINDDNYTMPHSTNVTADCLFCWTSFKDFYAPSNFRIHACVIKQSGSIKQQDEVTNVTVGQLKFSVELDKGWPWCLDTCRGGAGEFLDLDLSIKLPPGTDRGMKPQGTREPNRPKRFDLGAGAMVEFSTMALLDGVFKSLSHDTPSLIQKDGLNVITLRFPRFVYNMLYDPTVETGDTVFENIRATAAPIPSLSSTSGPLLLATIVALICAHVSSRA